MFWHLNLMQGFHSQSSQVKNHAGLPILSIALIRRQIPQDRDSFLQLLYQRVVQNKHRSQLVTEEK